jgi:hypothetical protein
MKDNGIHSISFSRDAVVLFIESASTKNKSSILEPVVNGKVIPTFEVKEWMFKE